MKKLLPLFFCFPLLMLAGAQAPMQYAPFMVRQPTASSWNPLSIAGYPAYAAYDAEGGYFSAASGFAVWTNLTANAGLDLTNRSSGTARQPAIVSNGLNGTNDYLDFPTGTGGTYLKCANYQAAQPHEMWFVCAVTNNQSWRMLVSGNASTDANGINRNAGGLWQISAPTAVNNVDMRLDRWMFLRVVFNGASSAVYTNNVLCASGNAGSGGATGLAVNIYYDLTQFYGTMKLAQMFTYRTNLTTAYATSNYYFLTNRYGPPE